MILVALSLLIVSVLATEPIVKVLNGSYAGVHLPQSRQDIFLGIPYAQGTMLWLDQDAGSMLTRTFQILEDKIDFGYLRPLKSHGRAYGRLRTTHMHVPIISQRILFMA